MRAARGGRGLGIACGQGRDGSRWWCGALNCLRLRLGNVFLVLPAEVDEGNTSISLKD